MATPDDQIPLAHLPLDVLRHRIARLERGEAAPGAPAAAPATDGDAIDRLLASVGLSTATAPDSPTEPLKAELARRLNEGRELARQRAALYRAHKGPGLLAYAGPLTRRGLERFIREAGARLGGATGAPPLYLLVPPALYRQHLSAIYNVYGAAIMGQPLVLATDYGPLKVVESDLVDAITLV